MKGLGKGEGLSAISAAEGALKVTSFKLRPAHLKLLNEEAIRGRHIVRGRLSRAAALRAVVSAWLERGRPEPELEPERPEDLETVSFSLDDEALQAIEDASVEWSSAERLVDKSQVVRQVIAMYASQRAEDSAS